MTAALMIEQAARKALRRALRLRPIVGYERDDALQDARIGAWHALEAGQPRAMVLAGYRRILDGRSARWSRSQGGAREHDLADAPEPAQPADAYARAQACEIAAAIACQREPLPRVAELLAEGVTQREIAARLGVTESSVSLYRARLQRVLSNLLGVPA